MLLMIDNYDCFTYNLVQYLGELGAGRARGAQRRAHASTQIEALRPERIVISPGPCTPNEAGISLELIEKLGRHDADPRRLPRPPEHRPGLRRRGRAGQDDHARQDLDDPPRRPGRVRRRCRIPSRPPATTRWWSSATSLPDCLEVTAWTEDADGGDEIMGLRHRNLADRGRAVPSRIDPDPSRPRPAAQLPQAVRAAA